ncbi:MAG: hypothetical protein JSS82_15705 [Bacteroidetes bacterium]|nr:hypothetical protein [Bacteroidota bacterium]
MRILGIDPGSSKSGYVLFDNNIVDSGKIDNEDMIDVIKTTDFRVLVIEKPVSHMLSKYIDETLIAVGRLYQTALDKGNCFIEMLTRDDVLRALFGKAIRRKAGTPTIDSRVIKVMKETYSQEALKGVKADAWQALGLVTAYRAGR